MPKVLGLGLLVSLYHVGTSQLGNVLNYWSELGPLIWHQKMLFHDCIEIPQLSQKCYRFPNNMLFSNSTSTGLRGNLGSGGLA